MARSASEQRALLVRTVTVLWIGVQGCHDVAESGRNVYWHQSILIFLSLSALDSLGH